MTKMKIYRGANISFDDDDVAALATLLTRLDADGAVIEEPPDFPLTRAQLVYNGNQATISVAGPRKNRRVCRLTDAKLTEPKRDGDAIVVTGTATELIRMGVDESKAVITATVTKYAHCATC